MTEKKLFLVTLSREITVPVYAEDSEEAEDLALTASDSGDVWWDDAEEKASAQSLPDGDHSRDDEVPIGLDDDDDGRTVANIRAGMPSPDAWAAARPSPLTPAALIEWLGRSPGHRRPWWGAVADGAAACNGYAVAWAEGVDGPDAETPNGKPWSEAYAGMIAKLDEQESAGRVTLASLREWIGARDRDPFDDRTRYGSILGVTLDRELVERWALPFVEMDGACEALARKNERDPIELRGDGWRVHIMPAHADPDGALAVEAA